MTSFPFYFDLLLLCLHVGLLIVVVVWWLFIWVFAVAYGCLTVVLFAACACLLVVVCGYLLLIGFVFDFCIGVIWCVLLLFD